MSVALAAGILPSALAAVEWPATIQRFERLDPQASVVVERGISLDELQLPASLRALVPLTDSQKSSEFEQVQPAADTSDGYETYDYYWYGYVAPRDAATRYENDERVVYYITYAGRDDSGKETSSVGEVAYRVYGTMGGGEASWYACNEGGIPNARIVDVDVSWDVADLDLSATGTYYLDGALTDSVYTSDTVPRAQVFVQEPQSCTCGAGTDAEEHAEGCPLHDENSCAEHVDGVEELSAGEDVDAAIAEIEGDAAEDTGEEASGEGDADVDTAAVGEAADAAAGDGGEDGEYGEAEADADEAEASECSCDAGDAPAREHAADCPSYVEPASADCHCAEDGGPIDAANFPWAHRSDCPCYSPAECMCREQVEVSVGQRGESGEYLGEETQTVPGGYSHVHDPANTDCPLYGQEAVKVTKERNAFAAVEDAGEASINAAAADADDGLPFSSYMAKDEATAVEAAQEEGQAPYAALGKIAVVEEGRGVLDTVAGVLHDAASAAVSLFAAKEAKAAAGAQDAVFKKFIQENIPSSVSEGMTFCTYTNPQPEDKVVTSAAWVSYVNSVFLNRCGVDMEWADVPGALAAWSGNSSTRSGTASTDALAYPVCSSGTWNVYSGEQLRYALENLVSGDTVKLQRDIDLNGTAQRWGQVQVSNKGFTFDGNGKTIYNVTMYYDPDHDVETGNMGIEDLDSGVSTIAANSQFLCVPYWNAGSYSLAVKNLTFANCQTAIKMVGDTKETSHAFGLIHLAKGSSSTVAASFSNVHVKNSRSIGVDEFNKNCYETFGHIRALLGISLFVNVGNVKNTSFSRCSVRENRMYGMSHMNPFAICADDGTQVDRCFTADNIICSVGIHSAAFMGCFVGGNVTVTRSFAANEMYGSYNVSGFAGFAANYTTDCFSTGKLEGFQRISGFGWNGDGRISHITRCYSTCLTGLRSLKSQDDLGVGGSQGGFFAANTAARAVSINVTDCYAAGEVGNFDVDMDTGSQKVGGFLSENPMNGSTLTNCFYDKQTTAMREWVTGEDDSGSAYGITGTLTSTGKQGTGLASGSSGGASGFTGFSSASDWSFSSGRYPQLAAFANASSAATDWGSAELANLARAYSLASTATVILDTWEEGYTWGDDGVRSASTSAYTSTSTASYKGGLHTYDTVRDIVSNTKATAAYNASSAPAGAQISFQVAGGLKVEVADKDTGTVSEERAPISIDASTNVGTPQRPGVEWANITCYSGGQSATRPIRLGVMETVEAGADATVAEGGVYDHRDDVVLTMLDTSIDNRVAGLDDGLAWSKANRAGYPDSAAFYDIAASDLSGSMASTADPKIYTDIRRVKQNADGSYVKTASGAYVEDNIIEDVTKAGTSTVADRKWTGQADFRSDVSFGRTYQVTYYLMTNDGRYRSDSKYVTVQPGSFTTAVNAYDSSDKTTKNTTAMHLGTAADTVSSTASTPDYSVSAGTVGTAFATDIDYGKNATLSWKKDSDAVHVTGGKLTFKSAGTTSISTVFSGELSTGKTITVSNLPYYTSSYELVNGRSDLYVQKTVQTTASLTYTVAQDSASGNYYLRLNKLANAPSFAKGEVGYPGEAASATLGGSSAGISTTTGYVNDMQFDVTLDMYVEEDPPFSFTKTASDSVTPLAGATFALYACGNSAHTKASDHSKTASNDAGCCWEVDDAVATKTSGDDGLVDFGTLATGQYMLVETAAPSGYALPHGQWMLDADSAAHTISITARGDDLPPAFKKDTETGAYSVANYKKWTLPLAGGTGIIAFTAAGAALVAAACAWLLFARRKKRAV